MRPGGGGCSGGGGGVLINNRRLVDRLVTSLTQNRENASRENLRSTGWILNCPRVK